MLLDGIWLRYGRRGPWVLRAVDAAVEPGEVALVQGRNGVGKSTLLQVAAGVLRPKRGRVRDRPPVVGWVPERFPTDQPFTVRQYLTAMGRVRGLSAGVAPRTVTAWGARLNLTPYLDVRLAELSKGTAQKVGLAQALLRPPGLLVLDEPWEGLDAAARELVPELVGEVCEAGGIVLVSDHRGETSKLPVARIWTVGDGVVAVGSSSVTDEHRANPDATSGRCIVEIAIPAMRVAEALADLRGAGHDILRVRHDPGAPDREGVPPERGMDDVVTERIEEPPCPA